MRRVLLFFLSFLLIALFLFHQPAFAATASIQTNTSVEGSGSVNTHIETTVNGQTQTFDSSEQGEHEMKIENDTHENTTDHISIPVLSPTLISPVVATVTPHIREPEATHAAKKIVGKALGVRNVVQSFVSALRHLFHLP